MNPKGIPAQSPGLRGTSYPGKARHPGANPNGVVSVCRTEGYNPGGVETPRLRTPRVARRLATLGWRSQSRWDWPKCHPDLWVIEGEGWRTPRRLRASQAAFTRLDLIAVLLVLSLCAAVVLPALASSRPRSLRVMCANNLRQIGNAFHLWGNDHGDVPPYAVSVADGGTRLHPLAVNPWLHFSWVSNELASPRVLLCPSDSGRSAEAWSGSPTEGYLHPTFANNATSYFLSHGGGGKVVWPFTFLLGDRNVGGWSNSRGSVFFNSALDSNLTGAAWWTNGLHGQMGNVFRYDGAVLQLSDSELRKAAPAQPWPLGWTPLWQFILPR